MVFFEGKKVKKVEGIPVTEEEVLRDVEMSATRKKAKKGMGQKPGLEDEIGI